MHELSLAEEIAVIAQRHASARQIIAITLSLGELAGVDAEALRFFLASTLKNVHINIEPVPALARCPDCGLEQQPEYRHTPCEKCGARPLQILAGCEFRVERIALAGANPHV